PLKSGARPTRSQAWRHLIQPSPSRGPAHGDVHLSEPVAARAHVANHLDATALAPGHRHPLVLRAVVVDGVHEAVVVAVASLDPAGLSPFTRHVLGSHGPSRLAVHGSRWQPSGRT